MHAAELVQQGVAVPLRAPRPNFAEASWTSLATGRRPHEHGVLIPPQPRSVVPELRLLTRRQGQVGALWNHLRQAGLQTHVVGWPVTFPAEGLQGVIVSDQFFVAPPTRSNLSIAPAAIAPAICTLNVSPVDIAEITLSQLCPTDRSDLSPRWQPQLEAACRRILAQAATTFRVLDWLLKERPWDFAAGMFTGLRQAHELAAWMEHVEPTATAARAALIEGAYEHHDLLLGQLLLGVGPETLVIAISTTGEELRSSQSSRPLARRELADFRAVLRGPQVKRGLLAGPRSILDVAPTILAVLDAPTETSLPGQALCDLFEPPLAPHPKDSADVESDRWDLSALEPFHHSQPPTDPTVAHLVELGYQDPDTVTWRDEQARARGNWQLNRVISLLDAGESAAARNALADLAAEHVNWIAPHLLLAEQHLFNKDFSAARAELDWLSWQGVESSAYYQLCSALDLAQRRLSDAAENLRCAQRNHDYRPGLALLAGQIQLRLRQWSPAAAAFAEAILHEGPSPLAQAGLATCYRHNGRVEEAALAALDALSLDPKYGRAHFELAAALLALGRPVDARRAVEAWIASDPAAAAPYRIAASLAASPQADDFRLQGRRVVRQRRLERRSHPAAGA